MEKKQFCHAIPLLCFFSFRHGLERTKISCPKFNALRFVTGYSVYRITLFFSSFKCPVDTCVSANYNKV